MVEIILQSDRCRSTGKGFIEIVLIFITLIAVPTLPFWFSTALTISIREAVTFTVILLGVSRGIKKRSLMRVVASIAIAVMIYSGPNVPSAF